MVNFNPKTLFNPEIHEVKEEVQELSPIEKLEIANSGTFISEFISDERFGYAVMLDDDFRELPTETQEALKVPFKSPVILHVVYDVNNNSRNYPVLTTEKQKAYAKYKSMMHRIYKGNSVS